VPNERINCNQFNLHVGGHGFLLPCSPSSSFLCPYPGFFLFVHLPPFLSLSLFSSRNPSSLPPPFLLLTLAPLHPVPVSSHFLPIQPPHLLLLSAEEGVTKEAYLPLGKELQTQSSGNLALWIAISDPPSPPSPEALSQIAQEAIDRINRANGTELDPSEVFLAGHGSTGFLAERAVLQDGYAGVVLLGSYLPDPAQEGKRLLTYPAPALVLAGELDGVARATRVALEIRGHMLARKQLGEEQAIRKKAVGFIFGANHAQVSSGYAPPPLASLDLVPEVEDQAALRAYAAVLVDFLLLNSPAPDSGAFEVSCFCPLLSFFSLPFPLLLPFYHNTWS